MADLVVMLLGVFVAAAIFIGCCAVLAWALPLERTMEWLEANDRHITSCALVVLAMLALLIAGSGAIHAI